MDSASATRVERALRTLEAEGYVKISRSAEAASSANDTTAEVDLDFTQEVAAEPAFGGETLPVQTDEREGEASHVRALEARIENRDPGLCC